MRRCGSRRRAAAALRWLTLAATAAACASPVAGQALLRFVPVGARYELPSDPHARKRDLDDMRRLHFNVVSVMGRDRRPGALSFLDRVIAGAPYPEVQIARDAVAIVPVEGSRDDVTARAWSAIARGARGVVFDDWRSLEASADALAAAAAFAEAVTRNAPLYAPLRPSAAAVRSRQDPRVLEARLLESAEAYVFIAINHGSAPQRLSVRFGTDVPEAIWRNMFSGASVSFVTAADGPAYSRPLAPKEVVVLAINKERTR